MSRREFSRKTREDALRRAGGQCEAEIPGGERCPCALVPGRYIFDHKLPDFMGGAPTLENCQVICVDCDRAKYRTDRTLIDKTRRISDRHLGIRTRSSRPMPGSRASGLKRGFDGTVTRR